MKKTKTKVNEEDEDEDEEHFQQWWVEGVPGRRRFSKRRHIRGKSALGARRRLVNREKDKEENGRQTRSRTKRNQALCRGTPEGNGGANKRRRWRKRGKKKGEDEDEDDEEEDEEEEDEDKEDEDKEDEDEEDEEREKWQRIGSVFFVFFFNEKTSLCGGISLQVCLQKA